MMQQVIYYYPYTSWRAGLDLYTVGFEHTRLTGQVMSEQPRLKVGVLSIQGAFAEHVSMLERERERRKDDVGITVVEVRNPSELDGLDGLIIPGGESTTMNVFLRQNGFEEKLRSFISNEKRPGFVWGTCAGLILLSDELDSQKKGGQLRVCKINHRIKNYYYTCISPVSARWTQYSDY